MKKRIRLFIALVLVLAMLAPVAAWAVTKVSILPLTIDSKSTGTDIVGTAEAIPNTALVGRESIVIYNADHATETIWCGDSSVTSSSGIPLDGTTPALSLDWDDSIIIYCISDNTSVSVRSLESK